MYNLSVKHRDNHSLIQNRASRLCALESYRTHCAMFFRFYVKVYYPNTAKKEGWSLIFFCTNRLLIRNVCLEDAPVLYDYRNHEACAKFQRSQVKTLVEIKQLLTQHTNDRINEHNRTLLAICLRNTGEMIGDILVMPKDNVFSLGYTISYQYHRRGYAFEALSVLIEQLHRLFPQHEFISFTNTENFASIALLKKLGYTNLGYVEQVQSQMFGKYVNPPQQLP